MFLTQAQKCNTATESWALQEVKKKQIQRKEMSLENHQVSAK